MPKVSQMYTFPYFPRWSANCCFHNRGGLHSPLTLRYSANDLRARTQINYPWRACETIPFLIRVSAQCNCCPGRLRGDWGHLQGRGMGRRSFGCGGYRNYRLDRFEKHELRNVIFECSVLNSAQKKLVSIFPNSRNPSLHRFCKFDLCR
jgi:hypothetical protein